MSRSSSPWACVALLNRPVLDPPVNVCLMQSPRDRWLCVLPGWQMNVNVNVCLTGAGTVLCVILTRVQKYRARTVIQNRVQQYAAYVDGGILVHAICFHRGLYSSDAHGECHDHGPVCACRTRRGAQPQSLRTTFLLGTSPATSASSASASATSRGIHRGFLERMQSSGGRGVYLRQNGAQGAF